MFESVRPGRALTNCKQRFFAATGSLQLPQPISRPNCVNVVNAVNTVNAVNAVNSRQKFFPVTQAGASGEYAWRRKGRWESIHVTAEEQPAAIESDSVEEFITEHYWGYTARGEACSEYQVEHPRWKVGRAVAAALDADVSSLYGEAFVESLAGPPASAFIADGSPVVVRKTSGLPANDESRTSLSAYEFCANATDVADAADTADKLFSLLGFQLWNVLGSALWEFCPFSSRSGRREFLLSRPPYQSARTPSTVMVSPSAIWAVVPFGKVINPSPPTRVPSYIPRITLGDGRGIKAPDLYTTTLPLRKLMVSRTGIGTPSNVRSWPSTKRERCPLGRA